MLLNAYSFFDAKSGCYSPPFFFPHRGQALRAAIDLGGDLSTTIGRYPQDFTLYELGVFDDQSGTFGSAQPFALGVVASFLASAQPPVSAPPPFELPSAPRPSVSNGELR
jgi:hypothetical protein